MKVRKAIIPAAGLGTRFLPATKAQPKEMLPIVDKPVSYTHLDVYKRQGSSGSEYCKPGRGDRHCLYGTLFLCNTKRGICRGLPYSQILFYRNVCVVRLLWIFDSTSCRIFTFGKSEKFWYSVSDAICGSRSD